MGKKTPIFEAYKDDAGLRLIDFGGWDMPLDYGRGIIAEHLAVRENAGLFDVSHMGEILVEGEGSLEFLNLILTNDLSSMYDGRCLYSPMCYPKGGVVDDLLVYRLKADQYLLVVNASNTDKDFSWIERENPFRESFSHIRVQNLSVAYGEIAFQGPRAVEYLSPLVTENISSLTYYHFRESCTLFGRKVLISRTGYTGEDGFEVYCNAEDAAYLWKAILAETGHLGVIPVGLGARDTLRFEACLPLYGHELSEEISPIEAGLASFVKFSKNDFCGKDALRTAQEKRERVLLGCELLDRGVARPGHPVLCDGRPVGHVTSGMKCPSLGSFNALVLVETGGREAVEAYPQGREIGIDVNGSIKRAKIVKTPFYRRRKS